MKIVKWFKKGIEDGVITVFSIFPFIFSLPIAGLIVLYKGFLWLKSGEWYSFLLINILPKEFLYTSFGQWLINSDSWKGLNKIVAWFFTTSIEWALIVFTFLIMVGCMLLDSYLQSVVEDKPEK